MSKLILAFALLLLLAPVAFAEAATDDDDDSAADNQAGYTAPAGEGGQGLGLVLSGNNTDGLGAEITLTFHFN